LNYPTPFEISIEYNQMICKGRAISPDRQNSTFNEIPMETSLPHVNGYQVQRIGSPQLHAGSTSSCISSGPIASSRESSQGRRLLAQGVRNPVRKSIAPVAAPSKQVMTAVTLVLHRGLAAPASEESEAMPGYGQREEMSLVRSARPVFSHTALRTPIQCHQNDQLHTLGLGKSSIFGPGTPRSWRQEQQGSLDHDGLASEDAFVSRPEKTMLGAQVRAVDASLRSTVDVSIGVSMFPQTI